MKQYTLADVCKEFGVDPASLPPLRKDMGYGEACQVLEETKSVLKKAYRKAIVQHHPDRGGDPEKAKLINYLWGEVKKCKVVRRTPQPQFFHVRTYTQPAYQGNFYYHWHNSDSTSSW